MCWYEAKAEQLVCGCHTKGARLSHLSCYSLCVTLTTSMAVVRDELASVVTTTMGSWQLMSEK